EPMTPSFDSSSPMRPMPQLRWISTLTALPWPPGGSSCHQNHSAPLASTINGITTSTITTMAVRWLLVMLMLAALGPAGRAARARGGRAAGPPPRCSPPARGRSGSCGRRSRVEPRLQHDRGRNLVDDLLAVGALHARLVQRALGRDRREALVVHDDRDACGR